MYFCPLFRLLYLRLLFFPEFEAVPSCSRKMSPSPPVSSRLHFKAINMVLIDLIIWLTLCLYTLPVLQCFQAVDSYFCGQADTAEHSVPHVCALRSAGLGLLTFRTDFVRCPFLWVHSSMFGM